MSKPLPRVTEVNRSLYAGGLEGELRLQRCQSCGRWVYFPRVACPHCLSDHLEWRPASGKGSVYSFALVYRPQHPSFNRDVPIVLAAIALAEGPIMISEIRGVDPDAVYIGMSVRAAWERRSEEVAIPFFQPLLNPGDRESSASEDARP